MSRRALGIQRRCFAASAALLIAACRHGGPATAARPARAAGDSVDVGYGTQAKRDVIGSIGSVDGSVVRQTTVTTFADMLDGHVAGVSVRRLGNGQVSVRIRGDRSFKADGEPLYVVDGTPMSGGPNLLPDIDPRDVRRIEVLKDAGSLAAYGSRGANGVILISMKRPPKP